MTKRSVIFTSLSILATSLACLVPTPALTPLPATPDENQIATSVAATLTAIFSTQPLVTEASPSDTPTPSLTPLAGCTPVHPGAQVLPLPVGMAAGESTTVTLYNFQGTTLATRPTAGISWMSEDQIHLAGNLSGGANNLPLVYYSMQNHGTLKSNVNNVITDLSAMPNLISLIGAEGTSYLSFVTLDMLADSVNRVYVGDMSQLAGIQPRREWTPPADGSFGNAIRPLALHYEAGQARGLWFTYTMYGIGDLIFPPYNGLSYLDLGNDQVTEFINTDLAVSGLSPDQTWIAYNPTPGGSPWIQGGFSIRNLVTCQETYISLDAGSSQGAGYVVFSPDNRFVAWVEASGPNPMDATFRLRVARTDGTGVFDSPIANLTLFTGGEVPVFIKPVGWAANHLLFMEVSIEALDRPILVIWPPDPAQPLDPALGAHQAVPIADGVFLGFIYP